MIENPFIDIMQRGGYPFMIPLLGLSIISLAVILERSFVLGRRTLLSVVERKKTIELAGKKDIEGIGMLFKEPKSIMARLLVDAVAARALSKGSLTFEKALEHSADQNMDLINERFWILRGISHIAPIIGLLGTVVGLAISFNNIGLVGLNQKTVASGISMALITTVAGLAIALPTIVAEYCLKSLAEAHFRKMRSLLHECALSFGSEP
jgi:biopolymer transport protein ExbB